MNDKMLWRAAIVAALATAATGLAAVSPGPAQAAVVGPAWVRPIMGTILTSFSNGLTLRVKPVTGSTGQYLFGVFKVNDDGTRTAFYENWANEHRLNGTTWMLGPGSPGVL